MCSIAGGKIKYDIEQMLRKMKHRSPDEEGIIDVQNYFMGMGRLAIIDLKSDGLCPYKEDNYVLVFNGEIYNYKELRSELETKGYKFRTKSDTEVLLKSYREWGEKCLDKFNGMFAFAIHDGKKIFAARDIAGEKPFYYKTVPHFMFASEAKALDWKCDELEPAHYLIYDLENKDLQIKRWWKLRRYDINPKEAQDELEWLLEDSIRLRTQSDVPYALYYSGGIDSALIRTFHDFKYNITYQDKDYKDEYLKVAEKLVWHLDGPVDSFSPFGLWKLAEEAQDKKIKVVLSGEGADELFGGYVRYVPKHFNYEAIKEFPSYEQMFKPAKCVWISGWEEFNGNLQELLRMGDRMSSAFGIENRCPFLDRRIIEFAFSLPDYFKIQGLETKVILRRLLEKRNPDYKHIEKKGLYTSVNRWIDSKEKFTKRDYRAFQEKLWYEIKESI